MEATKLCMAIVFGSGVQGSGVSGLASSNQASVM